MPTDFIQSEVGATNIPFERNMTPFEALNLLIGDAVIDHVLQESTKWLRKNGPKKKRFKLTKELIWKYIIATFAMGLAPLPAVRDYWKPVGDLYGNAFIQKLMPQKIFWLLNRCLHCDIDTLTKLLNEQYKKYNLHG
jgi:hypothetical protein